MHLYYHFWYACQTNFNFLTYVEINRYFTDLNLFEDFLISLLIDPLQADTFLKQTKYVWDRRHPAWIHAPFVACFSQNLHTVILMKLCGKDNTKSCLGKDTDQIVGQV